MGAADVTAFLNYFGTRSPRCRPEQKQALAAILFVYRTNRTKNGPRTTEARGPFVQLRLKINVEALRLAAACIRAAEACRLAADPDVDTASPEDY